MLADRLPEWAILPPDQPFTLAIWLLRLRRVIYVAGLVLVLGLGLWRDGAGWWLATVFGAALIVGCLGFLEGVHFQEWMQRRARRVVEQRGQAE